MGNDLTRGRVPRRLRSPTAASTTTSASRPLEALRTSWSPTPAASWRDDPIPPRTGRATSLRVLGVIDNQVRALRKRQVIDAFQAPRPRGLYSASAATSPTSPCRSLPVHPAGTTGWPISTRLDALGSRDQELLVNWGYAACDAGLRSFYRPSATRPPTLPYPDALE